MILATTLVLPGYEVPSQNVRDRRHWSADHRERKALTWRVHAALPADGCPHRGRRRTIEVLAYRRARIRDDANLRGGAKALLDALVAAGVLRDDSDRWMHAEYRQDLHRRAGYDQPTTVIRIYDLEAAP